MSQELHLKYRPKTLKEVIGQNSAVTLLKSKMDNGKMPHTILFAGPPGVGKTTLARIVARKVGCSDGDLQELNAANSRGIDMSRDIQNTVNLAPMGGPTRVWILDEVHKATKDAQTCLLKVLEEVPDHAYFLLCTTEPGRLLNTVKSRCTEVKLGSLTPGELAVLVLDVARREKITITEEACDRLVDAADGSARKALVILNQIRGLGEEEQLEAIQKSDSLKHGVDLARLLTDLRPEWKKIAKTLSLIEDDPETVRRIVLGYATKILLGGGPKSSRAYLVASAFRDNLYDTGKAGLILAAWEAVNSS